MRPSLAQPTGSPGEGRQGRAGHLLEEPAEESAESALRVPATSTPVPLFIPVRGSPSSFPVQAHSQESPPPHSKSPSQHTPLSWKLLSEKVVKMIKCEQIFSSFSTLIKNGLSIQRKLETK